MKDFILMRRRNSKTKIHTNNYFKIYCNFLTFNVILIRKKGSFRKYEWNRKHFYNNVMFYYNYEKQQSCIRNIA